MVSKIITTIFGDPRDKNFKRVLPIIKQINALDEQFESLSDEELAAKTPEFRDRIEKGESLDDLLPEAFACVKQACRRLRGESWEAAGQTIEWDMVPFDVQLCGAVYLHRGMIAEMATGEGKTLVATMPLYLNALPGKGAHLVTVNDYLARRDGEWMGRVFEKLGMTVGFILSNMAPAERREAYNRDVTYGTNNEFGFDYLRDNMAWHRENLVQHDYHYAIVDEVDSVLIDEARTPLIISGQVDRSTHRYDKIQPLVRKLVQNQTRLVNQLVSEAEGLLKKADGNTQSEEWYQAGIKLLQARKGSPKHKRLMKVTNEGGIQRLIDKVESDYLIEKNIPELEAALYFVVDEKGHSIDLTEQGRETMNPDEPEMFLMRDVVEEVAGIEARPELDAEQKEKLKEEALTAHEVRSEELHNVSQLLRAYILYEKDREYIIEDNKIIIIDEHTGRKMPGRRWSDGLHQAVECKEGVTIEKETQTLATITLQNFFRMYSKLSGMTGTAETEATEFAHTYGMNVAVIKTNKPIRRVDMDDLIYRTQREKYSAIVDEVRDLHEMGLPILVGTTSVENSEKLSIMLRRANMSHNVLNAKNHAREAEIVHGAGRRGAITIATNMAGRGTDIKLGPGVLQCRERNDGVYCPGCYPDAPSGAKLDAEMPTCGLHIIGSERHDSRRIDNQLRGRAGRQGDPGASQFFISLEDNLMRLFASERMANLMSKGFEDDQPLSHGLATRAIRSAQKKVEGVHFDQRKRTLEYDDVMNKQREVIYGLRRRVLMGDGINEDVVLEIVAEALPLEWAQATAESDESSWNVEGFVEWVRRHVPGVNMEELPEASAATEEEFLSTIAERIAEAYEKKAEFFGEEAMNLLARLVMLEIIDTHWRDHLLAMDELRKSIGLRAYGQKNPLTEYQFEASEMFREMRENVHKEITEKLFRATLVREAPAPPARMNYEKEEGQQITSQTATHPSPEDAGEGGGDGGQPQAAQRPRAQPVRRAEPKVGPNEPCPCGSGRKYKKCCGAPGSHGHTQAAV